jgi:hypothetical protein
MALLGALGASAQPVSDSARKHFDEGVKAFSRKDFKAALDHFEASYGERPVPAVLHNLGLTHEELGQLPEALALLEKYLRESEGQLGRRQVESKIAELRSRVFELVVSNLPGDAELLVDEVPRPAGATYLSPGVHRLQVSAPGFETLRQEVAGGAGTRLILPLALRPVPASMAAPAVLPPTVVRESFLSQPQGKATLALGSLSAASLVSSFVLGTMARNTRASYERGCAVVATCDQSLYDQGRAQAVASDVLLAVGGAAGVATAILLLGPADPAAVAIAPDWAGGGPAVRLSGSF